MRLLLLLLCLLLSYRMVCTGQDRMLQGVVLDSATLLPVADVHITSPREGVISSADGRFRLSVRTGDKVFFSHVSYKAFMLMDSGSRTNVTVYLAPAVRILPEIRILSFDTEEQFREKILTTEPVISRQAEVALENSRRMTGMGRFAPMVKSHADLYFESLQGPQGVTLFSSDPSKGISGMIRSIRRPVQYGYREWRVPGVGRHTIKIRQPAERADSLARTDSLANKSR